VYQRGVARKALPQHAMSSDNVALPAFEIGVAGVDGPATVCGVKLIRFKQLHGVCMCLCYSMLFGAGVMFIKRSKQLGNCQPFYAKGHANAVSVGSVIFELEGALVLGGHNFTKPLMMLASEF
jgi:hypothetical protein